MRRPFYRLRLASSKSGATSLGVPCSGYSHEPPAHAHAAKETETADANEAPGQVKHACTGAATAVCLCGMQRGALLVPAFACHG